MSNIFSGLDSMGLGNLSGMKLFEKKEKEVKKMTPASTNIIEVKEEDLLFDKSFTCPVCDKEFKTKTIRTGKIKLLGQDTDLRPRYQHVDSLKYDAVACPYCGYAALTRFFGPLTSVQTKIVKENISISFRGFSEQPSTYSYDDAIIRHKLALANAVIKHAKPSEKAYTCLKIAWLYRGKAEQLPAGTPDIEKIKKELSEQERTFLMQAYLGFNEAFSKEGFPMCGMDELTVTYLVADLARQCKKYDESLRMLARVLTSKTANDRIKTKAREIKELIREEVEEFKKGR